MICELLPWDSEFFGTRIGRVLVQNLDEEGAAQVDAWAKEHDVACLYFLAEMDDYKTFAQCTASGFIPVDVKADLKYSSKYASHALGSCHNEVLNESETGSDSSSELFLRPATEDDRPRLLEIAAKSFSKTRFFMDPHFDKQKCRDMYGIWVEKTFDDDTQHVIVGEVDGVVVGFIICNLNGADNGKTPSGRIGLVGIDPAYHGHSYGKTLVHGAVQWFESQGVEELMVCTQGNNIIAQRVYQFCGFHTYTMQVWFHKWYK
ncbi:MAG: GNAT family N-acetyltransferase [Desulfovibrio sp.]